MSNRIPSQSELLDYIDELYSQLIIGECIVSGMARSDTEYRKGMEDFLTIYKLTYKKSIEKMYEDLGVKK